VPFSDQPSGTENNRREHDHVNGEHEQRRVPDVAQQSEVGGDAPQRDGDEPGRDSITEIGAT
jgi:hypothetical protein